MALLNLPQGVWMAIPMSGGLELWRFDRHADPDPPTGQCEWGYCRKPATLWHWLDDRGWIAACEADAADPPTWDKLNPATKAWRLVIAEIWQLAETFGYWIRPYDMLADRRRWKWQKRQPCGREIYWDNKAAFDAAAEQIRKHK